MGFVPDNIITALQASHQLGIFLRIDTDPPLHLWFGADDKPAGFDSIDADGTVYLGGGRLEGVPTLEILVNGTSDSVEFTISGVEPGSGSKMIDALPPIRGAAVQVGITTLDQYYQPMSAIIPIWTGTASHVGESSPMVASTQSPMLTLSLSVVSGERTRSRPSRSLWSAAHQRKNLTEKLVPNPSYDPELPTDSVTNPRYIIFLDGSGNPVMVPDRFCDQTSRLARGVAPTWPRAN